ncbi:ABC transporter ATP-binding protein, partial [Idiomarina sp. UBA1919]
MLSIKDLHARVEETTILKGLNLEIKPGEVHAIMGPNGAGKSTLGYVLSGRDGYEVESGSVEMDGKDLLDMEVEERAQAGIFLAFQYPVEIPGVSNMEFMKESVNAMREAHGESALSSAEFLKKAKEACKQVELPLDFLKR